MYDIKAVAFGNELQSQGWFCDCPTEFVKCSVNLIDKVMISLNEDVFDSFSCGYMLTWRFRSQKRSSLTSSHKSNIQVNFSSWRVKVLEEKQEVDLIITVDMCCDC